MNVTLTPELERRVREKIQRGDYDNADALVQEAVHRLIEEDEVDLDSVRERLRHAEAEIDRGKDWSSTSARRRTSQETSTNVG